jgi:predicted O-methyltransferase YrrM
MGNQHVVYGLVKEMGSPVGAEIGVMKGIVSLYLLEQKKDLTLYSIDPYLVYEQFYDEGKKSRQHNLTQKQFDVIYETVRDRAKKFGNRSILLRESSMAAAERIGDGALDFVFIDANHIYDYVKEDILVWSKKVKPGGLIIGHDYNMENELKDHVCKAVDEFFGKGDVNLESYTCWWAVKK